MPQTAQAVTELYALLPEAFTAARNQRAGEAAKAGDKELGKAIRSLPKPSAGAWLVNMLALHRPELMSEALALGAALREAQADMDQQQLRQLSGERQRLLRSAAREARSLAEDLGHPVSPAVAAEVEQTLWAAMTDADAAAAAASAQLVRTLEANGWEPVTLDGALADPDSVKPLAPGQLRGPAPGKAPTGKGKGASEKAASAAGQEKKRAETARALRAARTSLADAQRDAAGAEEALQRAQAEVDSIADSRDELTDEIDELRERIRGLEREVAAVDRRAGTAERARDTARRTARAARRAVERAQAKVEDLG